MSWRKLISRILGCKVVMLTDFDGDVNFRLAWQREGYLLAARMLGAYIKLFPDGSTSKNYVDNWEEV